MDPMLRVGRTCQDNKNPVSTPMMPPPLMTPEPGPLHMPNRMAHQKMRVPNMGQSTTNQHPQEVPPRKKSKKTMKEVVTSNQSTQTTPDSQDQKQVTTRTNQQNNTNHNMHNQPNNNQHTLHATLRCDLHIDDNNSSTTHDHSNQLPDPNHHPYKWLPNSNNTF